MITRNKLMIVIVGLFVFIIYLIYNVNISAIIKRSIGLNGSMFKPCPNGVRILTVQPTGNLGNIIWEYMSLYAISKMYTKDYFVCYIEQSMKNRLESIFESLNTSTSHFVQGARPMKVLRRTRINTTAEVFDDNCSSVLLQEYSARYEDVINFDVDNIRKELRFKRNLVDEAMETLRTAQKNFEMSDVNVTYVGVHYRGTDYVDHLQLFHGDLFKGPPDYRYYVEAMDKFKSLFENIIFLLVTIDYVWLAKNEAFIKNNSNVVVNPYHDDAIKDLALLSHCNHTIINYGTFGVTAAFFNKGKTIVYNLNMPLDHRGQTVAMGISTLLDNWCMLPSDDNCTIR